MGSAPTRSLIINLVNYDIRLSLFFEVVGQNRPGHPTEFQLSTNVNEDTTIRSLQRGKKRMWDVRRPSIV